jgi:hypothetical protein
VLEKVLETQEKIEMDDELAKVISSLHRIEVE